jgi:hypothetical protein
MRKASETAACPDSRCIAITTIATRQITAIRISRINRERYDFFTRLLHLKMDARNCILDSLRS